jgi:hypothetical protein
MLIDAIGKNIGNIALNMQLACTSASGRQQDQVRLGSKADLEGMSASGAKRTSGKPVMSAKGQQWKR